MGVDIYGLNIGHRVPVASDEEGWERADLSFVANDSFPDRLGDLERGFYLTLASTSPAEWLVLHRRPSNSTPFDTDPDAMPTWFKWVLVALFFLGCVCVLTHSNSADSAFGSHVRGKFEYAKVGVAA